MVAVMIGQSPAATGAPSSWTTRLVQRLSSRSMVPKGLRSALPTRTRDESLPHNPTKTALRSLAKTQLREELQARGLDAAGGKPALVERLHSALASRPAAGVSAQRAGATADRPAAANKELLRLRERVAALDEELGAVQAALEVANSVRESERQQLEVLREEMSEMQVEWAADREALQDAVESSRTVAESEEEVRELQAQTVQFSERVVRLQTLVQAQDEKLAELKRKLAAAKPAFAMAGAGGDNGGAPSLEQLFSGLGSGEMLAAGPVRGYGSSMAEAAVSASALPASWPLDAPRGGSAAFRSDILQQPGVLGVVAAAATLSAAEAAGDLWATVRRLAPKEQRTALDVAAAATVSSVAAVAAWALAHQG